MANEGKKITGGIVGLTAIGIATTALIGGEVKAPHEHEELLRKVETNQQLTIEEYQEIINIYNSHLEKEGTLQISSDGDLSKTLNDEIRNN